MLFLITWPGAMQVLPSGGIPSLLLCIQALLILLEQVFFLCVISDDPLQNELIWKRNVALITFLPI